MAKKPLHDILCEILGNKNCYFEPPSNLQMRYPCIVYNHTNDMDMFADNRHYKHFKRYTVTIIDKDPDSEIPYRLIDLPYCTSDRNFSTSGLSHFVYTLYYDGPRIKEEEKNEGNVKPANEWKKR